ncbi:MAG: HypC/HybG/HupF family hydrogenase formation chaperone [Pseudonocardia sp.]
MSELPVVNAAHCEGDVCITCGDVAVPVRITELLGDGLAMVDTGVSSEEVSIALVTAGIGDVVLVHAKEAIAVVTEPVES